MQIMKPPSNPDAIARKAGKDMYGTVVGSLRRSELHRLGNAWGAKFPVGASKDFMLPFFIHLELEGKDPFRPPHAMPNVAVYSDQNHGEQAGDEELGVDTIRAQSPGLSEMIQPKPKSEFEQKLEALHHGKLKKICRERGIQQTAKDRKQDLIARIVAASEGNTLVQDLSDGC